MQEYFSNRVIIFLKRNNIYSIKDLLKANLFQLYNAKGCGYRTKSAIQMFLDNYAKEHQQLELTDCGVMLTIEIHLK